MAKPGIVIIFLLTLSACVHCRPFPAVKSCSDAELQAGLEQAVQDLSLEQAVAEQRLGVMLVDITRLEEPHAAGINQGLMLYAASLPKIAILYAALKRVDQGSLVWDARLQALAIDMIRNSANPAAAELFYIVGPSYIAQLLQAKPFRFYDRRRGGGLWVGKEYGPGPAWQREQLYQLSHAATPIAVARLYYYLEAGQLLSPRQTARMKGILADSALYHKFQKGLARYGRRVRLFRKSGSWRTYHSDSAIVQHGSRRYIAVALANDADAALWLERLIIRLDALIMTHGG